MEKDEVKVDSDWMSAIDGEAATDADRWKALLDEGGSGDVDILEETAYYSLSKKDRGKAWALAKGESG